MCADLCVHDTGKVNPHAHIMLTLRPFDENGCWTAKSRKEYILDANGEKIRLPSGEYKSRKINAVDWNDKSKAEDWRSAWADYQNAALERHRFAVQVDHRSYERQGLDKKPTVHLGPAAAQMEKKGIRTDRGNINRAVEVTNSKLRQQNARIRHAKEWLYSVPIQNAPTMIEMMNHAADGKKLKTNWQRIRNLQTQAKILNFLQNNGINDIEQLANKVTNMHERYYETANGIKEKNRRIATLNKHLEQYEIQKQNKAVYQKYAQLDPKKRDAYAEKYAEEIRLYKEAADYFKAVMNGRTTVLPIKEWKAELETLTAERYALCDEYYWLDDELKSVETLRRGAENIMRDEPQREQIVRGWIAEL